MDIDFSATLAPCQAGLPGARPSNDGSTSGRAKDYARETQITLAALAFTLIAWAVVSWQTIAILWDRYLLGEIEKSLEQTIFIVVVQGLIYGSLLYQFTRLGYMRRRMAHRPLSEEAREGLYDQDAPPLAILVPSFKEEVAVVRRTLLSAALQDYPRRRVVLLIDDPHQPAGAAERESLEAMRRLPGELQRVLDRAAEPFVRARRDFLRCTAKRGFDAAAEGPEIARLCELAAVTVEAIGKQQPAGDHGDALFVRSLLRRHAGALRRRAAALRALVRGGSLDEARAKREYRRLASLFRVELAAFERKRYVNLSHEPNKAMNLNSYIGLLGRDWREVSRPDGLHLLASRPGRGSLRVPAAEFLITLDADSLLAPEYALILVNEMLRPGNERLGVAQTPYNSFPNASGLLERIAGATTDIQYLTHQGFTQFDATYWVGANALLRVAALHDIGQNARERGFEVPVFIQDRTVIEDTESSIDLAARGWSLFNYPERLAYSATPPDFGSLLIQRRRWANGGLLVLPKLMRYLAARPRNLLNMVEGFFRVHYLASITFVNAGLLILTAHNFEQCIDSPWLPLTALPYFLLYARDLRYSGYRADDLVRVYALNLLLIPVNLGGVLKSLQQAVTGRRIPFGRTPKVSGRTSAPALYVAAEYALLACWSIGAAIDLDARHWPSAVFCLANSLLLAYAIKSFIGFRASWEDLRVAFARPGIAPGGGAASGSRLAARATSPRATP